MNRQLGLFPEIEIEETNTYTKKIKAPIYEPKNIKPLIHELYNNNKSENFIREIKQSKIEEEEKKFLIDAAKRHIVFNYQKIADYYAHASKEM